MITMNAHYDYRFLIITAGLPQHGKFSTTISRIYMQLCANTLGFNRPQQEVVI
jgi:hypothetical protein